jgi:hypothetical protein
MKNRFRPKADIQFGSTGVKFHAIPDAVFLRLGVRN